MKKLFILFASVTIFLNIACEESPIKNQKTKTLFNNLYGSMMEEDTTQIVALLYHISGIDYETVTEPRICDSYFLGYFTDGFQFVNPTNVSLNNIPLTICCDNPAGYFNGIVEMNSSNNFTANWNLTNYLGTNWNVSQLTAYPMSLTNFNCIDTISKSLGKTITYNGFIPGEKIYVDIQYDAPLTELFLEATPPLSLHPIYKEVADNGSLQILPSDLIDQTINCYYYLRFYHISKSTEIINDKQILKYSRYTVNVPFYLSN